MYILKKKLKDDCGVAVDLLAQEVGELDDYCRRLVGEFLLKLN